MRHQTLFREYVWLVNTIARHKRISLEDINRLWLDTDMSEEMALSRSTFNRHKMAIEDIFGIFIECDRKDNYKYYIENAEVLEQNSIQNWMLSTMNVNNLLTEHKSIHDRILLEAVPSSELFLSEMMEAMRKNVKVKIFYQKYSSEMGRERLIAPLCVKLNRRRWYVLGLIENGEMRLFSLDRIHQLTMTHERFKLPKDFDAELYFQNVVGVMTDDDHGVQRIVLRAFGQEKHYLRDLPIHASQREINQTETYSDFEYTLIPTSDFVQLLFARGGLQKVLEPQWLADKLTDMHHAAMEIYSRKEK